MSRHAMAALLGALSQHRADAFVANGRILQTPGSMTSKLSVLERVGRNDRAAAQECIESYSGLVWSLARRFLRNDADAEEAVQEIFVELWSSAHRYDPSRASESTFISMVARRRLIDRLRRTKREPGQEPLKEEDHSVDAEGRHAIEASA
ncbi:MAG: sigma-70 family RNA polymerase sigma factor, partial [Myxococcota bacterium]